MQQSADRSRKVNEQSHELTDTYIQYVEWLRRGKCVQVCIRYPLYMSLMSTWIYCISFFLLVCYRANKCVQLQCNAGRHIVCKQSDNNKWKFHTKTTEKSLYFRCIHYKQKATLNLYCSCNIITNNNEIYCTLWMRMKKCDINKLVKRCIVVDHSQDIQSLLCNRLPGCYLSSISNKMAREVIKWAAHTSSHIQISLHLLSIMRRSILLRSCAIISRAKYQQFDSYNERFMYCLQLSTQPQFNVVKEKMKTVKAIQKKKDNRSCCFIAFKILVYYSSFLIFL